MKTQNLLSWFEIFLILFALYILYQIVLKIFGGSRTVEEIIVSLVIAHIGFTLSQSMKLSSVARYLHHLRLQFNAHANDFKNHVMQKTH